MTPGEGVMSYCTRCGTPWERHTSACEPPNNSPSFVDGYAAGFAAAREAAAKVAEDFQDGAPSWVSRIAREIRAITPEVKP